jgi:hypothetical protein
MVLESYVTDLSINMPNYFHKFYGQRILEVQVQNHIFLGQARYEANPGLRPFLRVRRSKGVSQYLFNRLGAGALIIRVEKQSWQRSYGVTACKIEKRREKSDVHISTHAQ